MKLLAGCAGILVALATLLPPAFAARTDPYADQPGVLSADEIKAASEAMKAFAAGETGFALVASAGY